MVIPRKYCQKNYGTHHYRCQCLSIDNEFDRYYGYKFYCERKDSRRFIGGRTNRKSQLQSPAWCPMNKKYKKIFIRNLKKEIEEQGGKIAYAETEWEKHGK